MLSTDKKNYFLSTIIKLRQKLDAFKTENTLQALERFENQLALNELEECFFNTTSEDFKTRLTELFTLRWERIRGSSMCYTQKPDNVVNQLYLELAIAISPPITTTSEIEVLKPNTGPYCLLMPSLEHSEDIFNENIHSLGLHEFVLSDKERAFIPLAPCLHHASISDEGQLRHMVMIDGKYPELTPSEIERVSKHSKQASEFYQSVLTLNKQRLFGDDIGAKLSQLVVSLRSGGRNGHGSGTELNAGAEANLGILAFNNYWQSLSEQQKSAIFSETPGIQDIIGRLFRPKDVDYEETIFCVELLANALDPIIEIYNKKPSIQTLKEKVETQESAFRAALKKRRELVIVQNSNPPKHILYLMFKLSPSEQRTIFKSDRYENALMYALAHEPDALSEFELDEDSKQHAVLAQLKPNNASALIIAADHGKINAIKLLLSWGSNIESRDMNGSTALHWAAYRGHMDIVNYLLAHGALLEARGHENNTTLNFAVINGQGAVVKQLLKANANINARDNAGMNALDYAIGYQPELVDLLLMQLATLPANQQAECLINAPNGPYPHVLFYAAAHKKTSLFDALITKGLEQPTDDALFTTANHNGFTPLILAAQLGAIESLHQLIDFGLDMETSDSNGNTALHWAAYNGHMDVVNCLLERGALLEARGHENNTTLNFAVINGQGAVVKQLLKANANINARDNAGMNALDYAIGYQPELVDLLLMQLATLPANQQAECLINAPNGPYPHVLFYAAAHKKTSLFDALITKSLEQPNIAPNDALFTTANHNGVTPLILAAQLGAIESLHQLIGFGLGMESSDSNGNTALHWAAYNGHMDVINCLLEHGALLEARSHENNTTLNFAVINGQGAVVKQLLKANANINARDNAGMNALDHAIKNHPELVEPILMQLATLPADQQAECLLNVPNGPYPNVLFYVAKVNTNLLNNLLHSFNNKTLDSTMQDIHEHLQGIWLHYQKMKSKSLNHLNYKTATSTAETLLKTCTDEMLKIYQSRDNVHAKMLEFKNHCKEAIETARPVLTKYREWGKVITAFLLAIITLPISLPLYVAGFFSIKTKSEQLLDNLQEKVNKLG